MSTNNYKFRQTEIGEIPEDWGIKKLEEVTNYINRGAPPLYTEEERTIVLNQKCIRDGQVNLDESRFTNDEIKKITDEKYCKKNDILINSTGQGTLGRVGQIYNVDKPITVDSHVTIVRPIDSIINPIFLGYVLKSRQKQIEDFAEGSTGQTELSRDKVKSLVIPYPSIDEQKQIASILSSFDDKIELNQKIIKTLEKIGQALFKRWFVDFEFPNENRQPYKSSGGEMVESELGEVPKGWKISKLGDFSEIYNGFAFKSSDYVNKGVFLLRTRNFSGSGYVIKDEIIYLPESFEFSYKSYLLKKFDVLLIMVGASVGKMGFVTSNILPVLQNQNMWRFRALNETDQIYLKYLLTKLVIENVGSASGSAREFFRKDFFKSIKFTCPNDDVLLKFSKAIIPMFEKINILQKENENLTEKRELLLPKLLSGNIRT